MLLRTETLAALGCLTVGAALAAGCEGGCTGAELERQREQARRALREKAEALEAKKRAFAEEQRKEEERREQEAEARAQPAHLWPPGTPLSTLGCKEAHEQLAEDEPVVIDPDVERAIRGRLNRGTYLGDCNISPKTQVLICAAILEGKAEGVTAQLTPPDDEGRTCLERHVRRMRFPSHRELLVATTRFR